MGDRALPVGAAAAPAPRPLRAGHAHAGWHPRNIHATSMQHACNMHATYMQHPCNIHAMALEAMGEDTGNIEPGPRRALFTAR